MALLPGGKTLLNYPSKKIIWMIIAAAILVGGAFVYAEYSAVGTERPAAPIVSADALSATGTAAFGDWQKILGATDSVSAPLGGANGSSKSSKPAQLTETDLIGEALVSQYIRISQSSGGATAADINSAVSQVLNDPNIAPPAKTYEFSDIKIGKDDGMNAILAYSQGIGSLFKGNAVSGNNEAVDARDAVEQHDPSILVKIDPIISSYQKILGGLLALPTTPSLAGIHLDLVNAMSSRLSTARLLRKISSDPAAGLRGAGQYLASVQSLFNAFQKLQQYMHTRGIDFGTTTPSTGSGLTPNQ